MCRYFVADFETTVYKNQEQTEVWAAAISEMFTVNTLVYNNINSFINYFVSLQTDCIVYFHNLKFDISFIFCYFEDVLKIPQAYDDGFVRDANMPNNSYKYLISEDGTTYSLTWKKDNGFIVEFRDSYKLLPMSVKQIGKTFQTKAQKLEIEYDGMRFAGGVITNDERNYIINDVEVMREAMENVIKNGHDKLTIGSCCMREFKKGYNKYQYKELFPNLSEYSYRGGVTLDGVLRKSYRGGWCYRVGDDIAPIKCTNGVTLDVNSLYPSQMHSQSGNKYPVGVPIIEKTIIDSWNYEYIILFTCKFELKSGFLPFIQIKNNLFYRGNKMLKSYKDVTDFAKNNAIINGVRLCMCKPEFELFKQHYNIYDMEIEQVFYFYGETGLFDEYLDKYKKIKENSTGGTRQLAKLYSNNLYGKFATSTNSSYKIVRTENGILKFNRITEFNKQCGYIPIGAYITAYARRFTITAAQLNYYGDNINGFKYADTDSIHCDLPVEKIMGVKLHNTEYNAWKIENSWEQAVFVRQKTYIEICNGIYDIKCAGMQEYCKKLFYASVTGKTDIFTDMELKTMTDEEKKYISIKRSIDDFNIGMEVPGRLMPKYIKGGIILEKNKYVMRECNI